MPDVLLYGAPERDADLFHAVPAGITDPFLYAEAGGRRVAVVSVLDADNARAAGVDVLVAVGPRAVHFADGYGEVIALPDAQAAAQAVPALLAPGDTVLLKASRGVGLEVVARALEGA